MPARRRSRLRAEARGRDASARRVPSKEHLPTASAMRRAASLVSENAVVHYDHRPSHCEPRCRRRVYGPSAPRRGLHGGAIGRRTHNKSRAQHWRVWRARPPPHTPLREMLARVTPSGFAGATGAMPRPSGETCMISRVLRATTPSKGRTSVHKRSIWPLRLRTRAHRTSFLGVESSRLAWAATPHARTRATTRCQAFALPSSPPCGRLRGRQKLRKRRQRNPLCPASLAWLSRSGVEASPPLPSAP